MDSLASTTIFDSLQRLIYITDSYMKLPIEHGFNWSECFASIESGEWYLVVFRSRHRHNADKTLLNEYDAKAYIEARSAPGFLYYFMGTPAEAGECMSFCLWESQQLAQLAAKQADHQAAQSIAGQMYDWFSLERYKVRKVDGVSDLVFERL
ncbi:MAG: hypothetical protein ABI947_09675 [Chloroflexota bacterium]